MSNKGYILFLVGSLFLFFSCKEELGTTPLFQEAECLMSTAPDSAYLLLKSAEPTANFSKAHRAEWNLLITQAMDKAYMEHTTDSLIRQATTYYEKHKNPDRLILSYYYMGRVLQELGDAPGAQEYYLKALEIEPEKTDYNLLGLINNHIGGLYTRQKVYDKALLYLQEAAVYMGKAGNQRGESFAFRDAGRVYHQLDEMDQAICSYQMALDKATAQSRSSILTELSGCYTDINQMDSARIYLQEAMVCAMDSAGYYIHCLVFGEFLLKVNEPDSALFYLLLAEKSNRPVTQAASLLSQIDIARQRKDWEKYADLHTRYIPIEKIITKQKQTEIIRNTEQLYNYQLVKKDAQIHLMRSEQLWKNMIILILIGLLILAAGVILTYLLVHLYKRHKRLGSRYKEKSDQLEEKELEVFEMRSTLKEVAGRTEQILRGKERFEISIHREEKEELTKKEVDILFKTSDIYVLFQNNNDPGKISKENVEGLCRKIDTLYPNFKFAIHHLLPKITDQDMLLCYCIKADIYNKQIEVVMNCSEDSVTSRKYRLFKKVRKQYPNQDSLQSFIHSIY